MRILFLSPHSDPQAKLGEPDAGGQCLYENELATELGRAGHDVLVFCRQRNKHPAISRVSAGYTIYRITAGGERFIPKERIAGVLPEFTEKVIRILDSSGARNTPTVIHSHYWDGGLASLLLKANYRDFPLVWTPHSLGFAKREKFKGIGYEAVHHFIPRLMWENYTTSISNRIICSTRDEKRKLIRYYNCLPKRVEIIPPGLSIGDPSQKDKYLEEWGIDPDTHIILCLGRMARTKGYQHAIRIVKDLTNKTQEKFALVIVGGGSHITSPEEAQYHKELQRLALKLGVADKVIFHPSVPHEEIQSIYALSDFYLMTAEEEPFGLTVIEAMAAGCIVLAHNRGGSKNIIKNNSTGFVLNMHKYGLVSDLLSKLLVLPHYRRRMGERASHDIIKKYSWSSRLPQYLKVYDDIAHPKASRLQKVLQHDAFFDTNIRIPVTTPEEKMLKNTFVWPGESFARTDIRV